MFDLANFENLGTNKTRQKPVLVRCTHGKASSYSSVYYKASERYVISVLKKQQRRCYTLSRIISDIVQRRFLVGKKQDLISKRKEMQ